MRLLLKSASTVLFALSLALFVLSVLATSAVANNVLACAKTRDPNTGKWGCPNPSTCPQSTSCKSVPQSGGTVCQCK